MEEASSVAKAIEKGWIRAGKPQEFTVKVFEEAQKNFIGMTTKSAKVGLFFDETRVQVGKTTEKRPFERVAEKPQRQKQERFQKPQQSGFEKQSQDRSRSQPQERNLERQRFQEKPSQPKQEIRVLQKENSYPTTSPWSEELVNSAQDWLKGSLTALGQGNINFQAEVERYALRVTFPKLITQNSEKEKMLFRSWAYLLMQALRQKYKRPLKGLKIILMSNT